MFHLFKQHIVMLIVGFETIAYLLFFNKEMTNFRKILSLKQDWALQMEPV